MIFLVVAALMAVPGAQAQTLSCKWQAEPAPDHVRSPIQMDLHAAYRIFAFNSDGTISYRIRGEFPYAAFLSFTIYKDALVYAPLLDNQNYPRPGLQESVQSKRVGQCHQSLLHGNGAA